ASDCHGQAPTSLGYNADAGTACGLTSTGDVHDSPPVAPPTIPAEGLPPPVPVDAIPFRVIGCGTSHPVDLAVEPPPSDGDGNRRLRHRRHRATGPLSAGT